MFVWGRHIRFGNDTYTTVLKSAMAAHTDTRHCVEDHSRGLLHVGKTLLGKQLKIQLVGLMVLMRHLYQIALWASCQRLEMMIRS